jgi:hypothetical protein
MTSRCCWPSQPATEISSSRKGLVRIAAAYLQGTLQLTESQINQILGPYGVAIVHKSRARVSR